MSLIELFREKLPEIEKIGEEAAEAAARLGLMTDWQHERPPLRDRRKSITGTVTAIDTKEKTGKRKA